MNPLRLYLRYIAISIRGQMQYRASFVLMSFGQFLTTGIEFLGIWALFDRFGNLRGWSLPEVALMYGMVNVAFSFADTISRGFDQFGNMVKGGDFDRILLRPRSALLQVAGQDFPMMRVGRLIQGAAVLGWAVAALEISWSVGMVLLIVLGILGGTCIFIGLFILQATLCFWTTESLEILNTMTYGGVETAQYPLSVYRPWFRAIFLYVVPLACANYFPAIAVLGRDDPIGAPAGIGWWSPFVGVLFLLVTMRIWRLGVRRYRSTGS